MRKKVKGSIGFKEVFGVTIMSILTGLTSTIMQSGFMAYMTDYAGLGALGATLATTLLFAARIIDAVDDPIQGFIVDSAKPTKIGKYKPFFLLAFVMVAVGVSCLFFIPTAITDKPVMVCIWTVFFYLLYDIGTSFYNPNLLYRTMTDDIGERSKLITWPRVMGMALSIIGTAMMKIIVSVNEKVQDMHMSYGIVMTALMTIGGLMSILGCIMVKERVDPVDFDEKEEPVKITDIITLFKENKAMRLNALSSLFSGFIWTFLFSAISYYIKYGFCVNLETGEVNLQLQSTMAMISGLMMILPILVATFISVPILKKVGDPCKMQRVLLVLKSVFGLTLFILQMLGILNKSMLVFFVLMFASSFTIGLDFVPGQNMGMEIMDYQIYLTGKDRSALMSAVGNFITKAQNAVAAGMVGVILIAIGYEVDSATGDFVGELSQIPVMLNWFTVLMGLIPCILALASFLLLRKYPITKEIRAEMRARKMAAKKNEQN